MFTIKSDYGLSEAGYDIIVEWVRSILPEGNAKRELYVAKSMMKPLGLGYQKIDICPNFCMLYYLENAEVTECRTCGHSIYKPRTSRVKDSCRTCWGFDMWGLYYWRDINIYLVLFQVSIEKKNQSCSKAWRWWWSDFEWERVNILQS